ncbi:MAG TPA: hypothetical protein DCL44_08060 [Elusimicrobia bacterium]|nr:hypothetical protein [Elusimicrobiota bacterium]
MKNKLRTAGAVFAAAYLGFFMAGDLMAASSSKTRPYTQITSVVTKGPAVVAIVKGDTMRKFVVAYKKTGILGNSSTITAVMRVTYSVYPGALMTKDRTFTISNDWNGTGFMTYSLSNYEMLGEDGEGNGVKKIELSFLADGQWDSNYNANYVMTMDDFENAPAFVLKRCENLDIDIPSWNFITEQMRK